MTFTVSVSWTLKNYDRTSRPSYVLFYSGWSARKTLQELRGVRTQVGKRVKDVTAYKILFISAKLCYNLSDDIK